MTIRHKLLHGSTWLFVHVPLSCRGVSITFSSNVFLDIGTISKQENKPIIRRSLTAEKKKTTYVRYMYIKMMLIQSIIVSRLRLSRILEYLEVKIWSLF